PAERRDRLSGPETLDDDSSGRGVEEVTLDVTAGTTTALVGPTGSGKTTVAALMVRLFDADRGTVRLDGHDIRQLSHAALRSQTAIVLQDAFLFDDTVRNNITLGAEVSDDDVRWAASIARADEFVTTLSHGYDALVGERGTTLSGGQRQRIALARALLRRPRLLVLDDATSAIDPEIEADILRRLAAEVDTTVVLVAARTRSILLADEIAFFDRGRLIAQGTHERLLADVAAYRDLVTAYERARVHP
ncbi:MAG: ABC transporter ATP-binding protein, partial [Nitriliruptoraceae bacterium]